MPVNFVNLEKIDLSKNPHINEAMIQRKIIEDPSILGLGDDLIVKDKERIQPKFGRLDLLLQDSNNRRYEVEIQLGRTDESHIVRTIEYWDIERKQYRQYDHCAVIIAEDINTRFHNVISLFNGVIPLIAIQMNAYKSGDDVALIFTTVLNEVAPGLDEDGEVQEITDRNYWIRSASEETVKMADQLLGFVNDVTEGEKYDLKYVRFYIGLSKNGRANNFVMFIPRREVVNVEIKLPFSDEIQKKIENAGLDDMNYQRTYGRWRLRLTKKNILENNELIKELFSEAYRNLK